MADARALDEVVQSAVGGELACAAKAQFRDEAVGDQNMLFTYQRHAAGSFWRARLLLPVRRVYPPNFDGRLDQYKWQDNGEATRW